MKSHRFTKGIGILFGVMSVFIIQNTPLSNYSSYLLAVLIIISVLTLGVKNKSKLASSITTDGPVELFSIISIITLIISLTGNIASPFFFFFYFIFFLFAFISEPLSIWVLLASLLLYFFPEFSQPLTATTLIKIGSLIFMAPVAYFVSTEVNRRKQLNKKIEAKTDEIIQEAEALKEDSSPRDPNSNEAINEIIEEAQSLKEDSTN
jgi:hypothetical protein